MRPSIRRRSSCRKPARRAMPALGTALCPGAGEGDSRSRSSLPMIKAGSRERLVPGFSRPGGTAHGTGEWGKWGPIVHEVDLPDVRPVRPCMCFYWDWMVAVAALCWMK